MDIVDTLKKEWRAVRRAPFSFFAFVLIGISTGSWGAHWYYSKQLTEKDGELGRYRVTLGMDPASKGSLVELDNEELALVAQRIVAKLRDLASSEDSRLQAIKAQGDAEKLDHKRIFDMQMTAMNQISEEFESHLASDAHNVTNELQRRLSPDAVAHVVRVPTFDGVPITALVPQISSSFVRLLADEIEQMAKLLPDNSSHP